MEKRLEDKDFQAFLSKLRNLGIDLPEDLKTDSGSQAASLVRHLSNDERRFRKLRFGDQASERFRVGCMMGSSRVERVSGGDPLIERLGGVLMKCSQTGEVSLVDDVPGESQDHDRAVGASDQFQFDISWDGALQGASKEWEHFTGLSGDDCLQFGWYDAIHESSKPAVVSMHAQLVQGAPISVTEVRVRQPFVGWQKAALMMTGKSPAGEELPAIGVQVIPLKSRGDDHGMEPDSTQRSDVDDVCGKVVKSGNGLVFAGIVAAVFAAVAMVAVVVFKPLTAPTEDASPSSCIRFRIRWLST